MQGGILLLLVLAASQVLVLAAVDRSSDHMAVLAGGTIQKQHHRSVHSQPAAAPAAKPNTQLCKSLAKVMDEKRCVDRGVAVFVEHDANIRAARHWPMEGCNLQSPVFDIHEAGSNTPCSVTFASSAGNAENIWAMLPAGGLLVVPLPSAPGSSLLRTEALDDPEGFIWQVLYQVHSSRFFTSAFDQEFQDRLGLPELQFATFFSGHVLLQKADWNHDLTAANSTFSMLAKDAATNSIDQHHNYSLLYHRHLDEPGLFRELGGMMLEVGLGCVLKNGSARAGSGVGIWPRLFPNVAVHVLEKDRECFATWQPQMQDFGVAKVHIGHQADPTVLAEVLRDVKFAQPGGFCSVVDDGSPVAADKEAMFRSLFPHLKPGGLYFVEDVMYSSWSTYKVYQDLPGMKIQSKHDHSSATPVALAAVLAAAATGVTSTLPAAAKVDNTDNMEILQLSPPAPSTRTFLGHLVEKLQEAMTYFLKPFAREHPVAWTLPVASFHNKEKWRQELLSAFGGLVDLVECTPGICVFRRA